MSDVKRVVIVGGGVIGLVCAVRLAKAGARVTLLEAEAEHHELFGPGASVAAAGMLSPLNEEPSLHDALAFESLDLWRFRQAGAEWADGVRFDGGVVACASEADAAALIQRAQALGRRASLLNAAQVKKRTNLRAKIDHAVLLEDEGVLDPARVLSGLSMQARAHGVIVDYRADVNLVEANHVTTQDERVYEADLVLLTPGAWANDRMKAVAPAMKHIRAGKGELLSVKLERDLGPNFHGPGFYLAQRREDVVLGATLEYDKFDRHVDQDRVAALLAAAQKVLPDEIETTGQAWAGVRPMSPDGWPMVGPSGDALVAAGHSRNGWLLAPITAEIITAYVFDAAIEPAWAALSPERFEKQA